MDRPIFCSPAKIKALPAFLHAVCSVPTNPTSSGPTVLSDGDSYLDDPEKVEYLRQLIEALYEARAIVTLYNVVIVAVLLVLTFLHWRETKSDHRKWRMLQVPGKNGTDGSESPPSVSSSSSTVAGISSPPLVSKDIDIERVPLLGGNRTTEKPRKSKTIGRAVSSWLAYQPPPLPVVNRTLPSNGTSLFVLAWLALNVFFHFFRLPLRWDFFFIFADRTGFVFIVNLPLLYLLSAKNQPIRLLTGYSYEALNVFHRRVGELMCFEAVVHFVGMLVWQFVLAEEWLVASWTAWTYFTHPLILFGIGAFVSYELLYFTSLASFRQRWYELFLASHVVLQVVALVFLWLHFYTSRPYVALALVIFLADRLIWRLTLKRVTLTADICILDKDTYLLSADWAIPQAPQAHPWWQPRIFRRQSVLHGWHPTDHVFLTVPALGRTHSLQAHPFTIASAAPGRPHDGPEQADSQPTQTHAWFSLLVRAHTGFTRDLLLYALTHSPRLSVRLDGPYGSPHALRMLRASGCAVLVAGGSGIAVTFPLVWALLNEGGDDNVSAGDGKAETESTQKGRRRRVCLLWVTHSRCHREWVPSMQLRELEKRGLELVVPEPTVEAGRPDVAGLVGGWIEGAAAEGREVGVVVSGPDGMNRVVRNVCAGAVGRGREVRVAVEKFGW